jgi:hypothetical protein
MRVSSALTGEDAARVAYRQVPKNNGDNHLSN